jgi:hypothetical protein
MQPRTARVRVPRRRRRSLPPLPPPSRARTACPIRHGATCVCRGSADDPSATTITQARPAAAGRGKGEPGALYLANLGRRLQVAPQRWDGRLP